MTRPGVKRNTPEPELNAVDLNSPTVMYGKGGREEERRKGGEEGSWEEGWLVKRGRKRGMAVRRGGEGGNRWEERGIGRGEEKDREYL